VSNQIVGQKYRGADRNACEFCGICDGDISGDMQKKIFYGKNECPDSYRDEF